MDCAFCVEPIEERDEVADTQFGEAETDKDGEFFGEVLYSSSIETSHRECYEKALDLFQRKGGE